jgi:outer membrane protein assembly factor BamD
MTAAMFHTPSKRQNLLDSIAQFAPRSLLAAVMALSAGCSSGSLPSLPSLPALPALPWSAPVSAPNASAETLYKEGNDLFNKKRYALAIDRFQRLRSEHPFAPEVVSAEFKLGEAYYLNQQYTEAVETLKQFEAMHPSNENVPYAVYLSGMAHFDQFSSIDRDQKVTEIAKGYFERVINNYPQSPYAAKAREKLAKCIEYLAEHEFYIASFYMSERKYPAARDRFEGILRLYKNTPTAAKALYHLGESYRHEKNYVKASLAYEALVEHYPRDPLVKSAQAQLKELAQEKRDPLAILLKPEGRPAAPIVAENKTPPGEVKQPSNLVAKTEVVDEKPGEEKNFLGRMVDKINPFAPPAQIVAPEQASLSGEEKKGPAAGAGAAGKKESGGLFSSLWPFGKKQEAGAETKTASARNPQLVGKIDDSLKQRGIDAEQGADPKPPAADLPKAPPAKPQLTPNLDAIDSQLEKKGKTLSELPAPPEAAPVLKTPFDGKEVARAKAEANPPPDTGTLLSNIDQKLKGQGIDAAKAEAEINKKTEGAPKVAAPRPQPKPTETIQLEPRLSTEKSPLFLQPQEFQPQEKTTSAGDPEQPAKSEPSAPNPGAAPQPQTLPELAIKGPPEPAKEKPAETKTAKKPPSSGEEEEVEGNKGAFDQLKEDVGKIGRILNPFNW